MGRISSLLTSLALGGSVLAGASEASAQAMGESERREYRAAIGEVLADYWGDPDLETCWEASGRGDDRALFALGTIAEAMSEITADTADVQRILEGGGGTAAIYAYTLRRLTPERVERIGTVSRQMPRAWQYCEALRYERDGETPPEESSAELWREIADGATATARPPERGGRD